MKKSQRRESLNEISGKIVDAAIEVHKALGPGLLESAYETCLAFELVERGLGVETQKHLPLRYKKVKLESAYRLDLLVEREVVVEIKSVESITPLHKSQLLSYLRLSGLSLGLLLNFNVRMMKNGIHRYVLGEFDSA